MEDWCDIFDTRYTSSSRIFEKNYSTSRQVVMWNKKTDVEQKRLLDVAKSYLS